MRLQQIQEKVLEEIFQDRWNLQTNKKEDDVLIFPRKKIKVRKLEENSSCWFVQERLRETATKLEKPTEKTGLALTSGYRSIIIKERNGEYTKLKGVAYPLLGLQGSARGCCDIKHAFREQVMSRIMQNKSYIAVKPKLLEIQPSPRIYSIEKYNRVRSSINDMRSITIKREHLNSEEYSSIENKIFSLRDSDYSAVSLLKISGDTRLDETIYHLTKKELSKGKKELRDEMLKYLCFWSGFNKAKLTLDGFCWSGDLTYTDAHIGNFVVIPNKKGKINSYIADIAFLNHLNYFKDEFEFLDYSDKEVNSFRDDLMANTTFSTPSGLKYNFFSDKLREECFYAIETGYKSVLDRRLNNENDIIPLIESPKKIVVPKKFIMSSEEFKENCKGIMS